MHNQQLVTAKFDPPSPRGEGVRGRFKLWPEGASSSLHSHHPVGMSQFLLAVCADTTREPERRTAPPFLLLPLSYLGFAFGGAAQVEDRKTQSLDIWSFEPQMSESDERQPTHNLFRQPMTLCDYHLTAAAETCSLTNVFCDAMAAHCPLLGLCAPAGKNPVLQFRKERVDFNRRMHTSDVG